MFHGPLFRESKQPNQSQFRITFPKLEANIKDEKEAQPSVRGSRIASYNTHHSGKDPIQFGFRIDTGGC